MYTLLASTSSIVYIQFCPVFLENSLKKLAEEECHALTKAAKAIKAIEDAGKKVPAQSTAADLTMDFAATIMHELTHTPAGGSTQDLEGAGEYSSGGWYGWTHCVALKDARNADSIAFIGAMVRSILKCEQKPTLEGDMVAVKKKVASRYGRSAPAGKWVA